MLIGIILLLLALSQSFLGVWFLRRYQKNQATLWFGLFAIGSSLYVGANAIGYINITDLNTLEKISWSAGVFLTASFLAFTYSFPIPKKSNSELIALVIWPSIALIPAILFTDLVIGVSDDAIFNYNKGFMTVTGKYFFTFIVFFATYWTWSITNLIQRTLKSDGVHRWQLKKILTGVIISLSISVTFDIIIPLITLSQLGYIGSLSTTFWLGFTSIIILKK